MSGGIHVDILTCQYMHLIEIQHIYIMKIIDVNQLAIFTDLDQLAFFEDFDGVAGVVDQP
jgi:hypothetical protein